MWDEENMKNVMVLFLQKWRKTTIRLRIIGPCVIALICLMLLR